MATNAYIAHEDGTPLTEAEMEYWKKGGTGCPDCDALSAPEWARREEQWAAWRAESLARTSQPINFVGAHITKRGAAAKQDPVGATQAFFIDPVPVRCPQHVLRKHPWIEAVKLEDLDIEVLEAFVSDDDLLKGKHGWVPYLAAPNSALNLYCYEDREFSQAEIQAEIARRKGKRARAENAMQKYQRLSRVPQFWITDAERKFLQSRDAALVALKLKMR